MIVRSIALVLAAAFAAVPAFAIQYTAVALGMLNTASVGMNASGDVATYYTGEDDLQRVLKTHAQILKADGRISDLGTLPGRDFSAPVALNDRGDVIGRSFNLPTESDSRPFIYHAGTMSDLAAYMGLPASSVLHPHAINNSGDIAADLEVQRDDGIASVVFVNGVVTTLPAFCRVLALNAAGQATGACTGDSDFGPNNLFVYDAGHLTLLPEAGSVGWAINDQGQIAGFAFKDQNLQKAFVYSRSEGMKEIGALGKGQFAAATAINNHGQVVGESTTAPPPNAGSLHAWLYSDGQMYDLNDLVVAGLGTATLRQALAINDNAQILAYGCLDGAPPCQYYRLDPTPHAANYGGLWWGSPAGRESGWGVNITHQGDILFATWFTYDTDGSGMWLVMSDGRKTAPDTYTGTLYRTTGPSFSSRPWDPSRVGVVPVGTASFAFTGRDDGTFTYRVGEVSQSKAITRQIFALPVPDCIAGAGEGVQRNYQALWWNYPEGSESGWGLNIAQQGGVIFATWFTYDSAGKPLWLVMPDMRPLSPDRQAYSGTLYRTTGPAFSAVPWDPSHVTATPVGTASLSFARPLMGGWNFGSFSATVNGLTTAKAITRQVFSAPTAGCN